MKKNFFIILILLFFFEPIFYQSQVQADNKKLYDVEVTFESKGAPVFNSKFTILNLQNAYDKIKSGDITKEDVNSSGWQEAEQQRSVIVQDTFGIGIGIKHTSEESESILRNMYASGAASLVGQLNGSTKEEPFHYPQNISRRYTNNEGKATVKTAKGLNGVFDESGSLVQLLSVRSDSTNNFSVDINNTTELLDGKITNLSDMQKANENSYTVEFGQELTYQLTVDKTLLTQELSLVINPQTNLVIDDISLPFTKVSAYGDVISLQSLGMTMDSSISPNASQTVLRNQIQKNFYKNTLWGYAVTVPKSDENVIVTIKAHLTSGVRFQSNLQGVTKDGSLIPMEFVVGNDDIKNNTLFFMNIVASGATGTLEYSMPTVRTSGINFVSVNDSVTKLERKQSYILGYEKDNQKYIYGDNKWNPVSSLDNIDLSTVQTFLGGNQYYLGGSQVAIPLNTKLFSFNAVENRKVNESLIKFIGLGQDKKYFLYPLDSQQLEKKELYFTVYNKDSLRSNGQKINQTSIGNAQYENYNINSLIPDYRAGSVEYNVTSSNQNLMVTLLRVIFEILGVCILISVILIFICWKGR